MVFSQARSQTLPLGGRATSGGRGVAPDDFPNSLFGDPLVLDRQKSDERGRGRWRRTVFPNSLFADPLVLDREKSDEREEGVVPTHCQLTFCRSPCPGQRKSDERRGKGDARRFPQLTFCRPLQKKIFKKIRQISGLGRSPQSLPPVGPGLCLVYYSSIQEVTFVWAPYGALMDALHGDLRR